eukprot:7355057-Ditylum_brightwellii.AAC.1
MEGFMRGANMMQFIPLHKTASEASPAVQEWVFSWAPGEIEILEPEGWFERGHDITGRSTRGNELWYPHMAQGVYVWELAPVTAVVEIEELHRAMHNWQTSARIVLIPHLMAPYWQQALYK